MSRDLNSRNIILFSDGIVKLIDFGGSSLAHPITDKHYRKFGAVVSSHFAPEAFAPVYEGFNIKSDIWSLGITIFQMIFKESPLYLLPNESLKKAQEKISKNRAFY